MFFQIISLLQRASLSKQPLTGLYYDVAISPDVVNIDQLPKIPKQADGTFYAIKIKLVHTKDDSSVLYAEVGEDFVDLIFGLLCVPLGSVIKTYVNCLRTDVLAACTIVLMGAQQDA
jgi:hypothetical protein